MDFTPLKGLWVVAAAIGTFVVVAVFAFGFFMGRCG